MEAPKTIVVDVIRRFMTEQEFNTFMTSYMSNKKKLTSKKAFDAKDWEMFNANATLEEFMAKWGVKKGTATFKLGKMALQREKKV